MSTVTDLAVRENGIVEQDGSRGDVAALIDQAEVALPMLVEEGATEAISELATRAKLQAEFERSKEKQEEADKCLRLVIRAQASIGLIDVVENPPWLKDGANSKPLVLDGGREIASPTTRRLWRTLAIALDRGTLDAIMDEFVSAGGSLTAEKVANYVRRRGETGVSAEAVGEAIRQSGRSTMAVMREAGVSKSCVGKDRPRLGWWTAKRIARVLGEDPLGFPMMGITRPKRVGRRWARPRLKGVRTDEALSLTFALGVQLEGLASTKVGTRHDEVWAHLYAIRDFLSKRQAEEARHQWPTEQKAGGAPPTV